MDPFELGLKSKAAKNHHAKIEQLTWLKAKDRRAAREKLSKCSFGKVEVSSGVERDFKKKKKEIKSSKSTEATQQTTLNCSTSNI